MPGLPIGNADKEVMIGLIQQFSKIYFVEVIGYVITNSHIHLLAKMLPEEEFSEMI